MKTCLIPGSFDPITNGHVDIIERAAALFDKTIIAVMNNPRKKCVFSLEERMHLIKEVMGERENVEVDCFDGLMVDYAAQKNVDVVVRGLRAVSDFEYEFQLDSLNRHLSPKLETVFFMTDPKYSFLSASSVREIGYFGGDIKEMIPSQIYEEVSRKLIRK